MGDKRWEVGRAVGSFGGLLLLMMMFLLGDVVAFGIVMGLVICLGVLLFFFGREEIEWWELEKGIVLYS